MQTWSWPFHNVRKLEVNALSVYHKDRLTMTPVLLSVILERHGFSVMSKNYVYDSTYYQQCT